MRRREFIAGIAGSAAMPLAARAQEWVRRIGVPTSAAADSAEASARLAAFVQGLQQSGWIDGRNVQIDVRWGGSDPNRSRRYVAELVALAPDVILATGSNS